jgi:hypothetical protein
MVHATGIATANMFLPNPRDKKPQPVCIRNCRTVSVKPKLVLNISFLMTSSGFCYRNKMKGVLDMRVDGHIHMISPQPANETLLFLATNYLP